MLVLCLLALVVAGGVAQRLQLSASALQPTAACCHTAPFATASAVPPVLASDPDDRFWDAQFGALTKESVIIQAVVRKGDSLIVGGSFGTFQGMQVNSLLLWDGKQWMPLIAGGAVAVTGSPGVITALALGPDGSLYIAGEFARIGSAQVTKLARYNWQTVQQVPGSFAGTIRALAFFGGELYAAGSFTSVDSIAGTAGIARWDGTAWHAVGGGIGDGSIGTLFVAGNSLYAGGSFRSIGGIQCPAIARWDGTQWQPLGEGFRNVMSTTPAQVLAIDQLPSGEIIVAGDFNKSGNRDVRYLARWTGSQWQEIGPPDYIVSALLVDGDRIYISGGFVQVGNADVVTMAWWDGNQWQPMDGEHFVGSATILLRYNNRIVAAGNFQYSRDGRSFNGIAEWDGTSWIGLGGNRGNGLDGEVADLATDADGNVYAVGTFTTAGPLASPRIACFTGSEWRAVAGVPFSQQQRAFHKITRYVGGSLALAAYFSINAQTAPMVIRYDLATQSVTVLGQVGGGLTARSIFALAYDSTRNKLYVGGNYRTLGGDTVGGIAVYDGERWSSLGGGIPSGSINAIAVLPDGSVVVGGSFSSIGGVAARSIARWDGTRWQPLGEGIGQGSSAGTVNALLVVGQRLYVGGSFSMAGTVSCANFAWYDLATSTWQAPSSGTNQAITALAVYEGEIIAGGNFTTAGDSAAAFIARFNPQTGQWRRMGSGLGGTNVAIRALAVARGALCVGGTFQQAGGRSSRYFARWLAGTSSVEQPTSEPASAPRLTLYPMPLAEGAAVALLSLPEGGSVTLEAYTLDGRRLGTLWEGLLEAGTHTCRIDASLLPRGATLIVARVGGKVAATAVALVTGK